jgi:hypothetical protein
MGLQRIGTLPDTEPWRQVVRLIAESADADAVASATTAAAVDGLDQAQGDEGIAHCLFMLARLSLAARGEEFADNLRQEGLVVSDQPDLFDIVAAFSSAIDGYLDRKQRRTDLGEMAEMAAIAALTNQLGQRSASLYGSTAAEVRQAAQGISTDRGFGTLAHEFVAGFVERFLGYHLGRELSLHVGGNGRFADPEEHNEFVSRLGTHCREIAAIMRRYAADWFSKENSPAGSGVTPAAARRFTDHVLKKVRGQISHRGERDV